MIFYGDPRTWAKRLSTQRPRYMSFHEIKRHITRDSKWIKDHQGGGNAWLDAARREIADRFSLGEIRAQGRRANTQHPAMEWIPPEEWRGAAFLILGERGNSTIDVDSFRKGHDTAFTHIRAEARAVLKIWPKLSRAERQNYKPPVELLSDSDRNLESLVEAVEDDLARERD